MQTGFTLAPGGVWKGTEGADYWNSPDRGSTTIYGSGGNDTIKAGFAPDEIHGGAGNDTIYGREGYDRISGDAGDDDLHGGPASDIVNGGDGNDRVYGDAGRDLLIGGKGNNWLTGGSGSDAFLFNKADFDGGRYTDHITDFHAAEQDAIHFSASEKGHTHFALAADGGHITSDLHDDTIIVDNIHQLGQLAQLAQHVFYDLA